MAAADIPKLYYFDGPGRAEIIRLIFAYTGNNFEDVRFKGDEWGTKYKALAPFGMAPFYEEGGVKLAGSLAIARYVGEKYGLGGASPLVNAQLESYADALADIGTKIFGMKYGPEAEREGCKAEFLKSASGKFEFIEKQLKKDSFLDGKVTWPDLMVYSLYSSLTWVGVAEVFKDTPKVKAVYDKFVANEKIKAYSAKHPLPST